MNEETEAIYIESKAWFKLFMIIKFKNPGPPPKKKKKIHKK